MPYLTRKMKKAIRDQFPKLVLSGIKQINVCLTCTAFLVQAKLAQGFSAQQYKQEILASEGRVTVSHLSQEGEERREKTEISKGSKTWLLLTLFSGMR